MSGFFKAITSYVTAPRKSPIEELSRWVIPKNLLANFTSVGGKNEPFKQNVFAPLF